MTSIDSRTIGSFALRTPNRTRCRKSPPTTFRAGWRPPPLASWIIVVFGSAAKRFAIGDEKLEVACVWLIDAYRAFVEGQRRFRAGVGSFDACLHTAEVQRRPSDARAEIPGVRAAFAQTRESLRLKAHTPDERDSREQVGRCHPDACGGGGEGSFGGPNVGAAAQEQLRVAQRERRHRRGKRCWPGKLGIKRARLL